MSIDAARRRQAGLSLVEMVMFMVIVSIAVMGVVQTMNLTVRHSADPLLRKQALLIAESLMEEVQMAHFTFCAPSDDNAESAQNVAGCTTVENVGAPTGTRPHANVNDYVGAFDDAQGAFDNPAGVLVDVQQVPLPVPGYSATLKIVPVPLGGGPNAAQIPSGVEPAAMNVLQITVTVNFKSGSGDDSVVLDGYRTRYAPNSI